MWVIAQGCTNQRAQPKIVNLDSFDFVAIQEGYALDRSGWYVIARHMMPNGTAELPLVFCHSAEEADRVVRRIGDAMNDRTPLLDLASGESTDTIVPVPRSVKDLAVLARR